VWQLPFVNDLLLGARDNETRAYADGLREAVFRESALSARKFTYCRAVRGICADMGRHTWASMAAYEACFFAARAYCYLLGFASLGRDSDLYVDAFAKTEHKQGKQRIRRMDSVRLHRLGERLTHQVLWGLFSRLLDTCTFVGEASDIRRTLRSTDWGRFSRYRNRLLYDGAFWSLRNNFEHSDLVHFVSDLSICGTQFHALVYEDEDGAEYHGRVDDLRALLEFMLSDIAKLAPSLEVEAEALRTELHLFY